MRFAGFFFTRKIFLIINMIHSVTCTVLMAIVFVGTRFESKMQIGLLVILTLSIANYMVGSFFPINDEQRLRGLTGYSCKLLRLSK